ncbi:MAG: M10 family metallopeptidase C-terminal domain-containing protein [Cyanobacteria bacterium P01_A01_bin.40]
MSFDIAAIQHLYRANETYAIQGNAYQLPVNDVYSSIWDTGGIDVISASNATASVTIDLRPAPLVGVNAGGFISSAANVNGGFTIANGVVIEDMVGSSYADILMGNQRANDLAAGGGTDTLIGGGGADTLTGADSTELLPGYSEYDTLTGGDGADTFALGDSFGAYYQDFGFATITDFDWIEVDKIQVFGTSSDYTIENIDNSTDIYFQDDLIGSITNTNDVLLSFDFEFA